MAFPRPERFNPRNDCLWKPFEHGPIHSEGNICTTFDLNALLHVEITNGNITENHMDHLVEFNTEKKQQKSEELFLGGRFSNPLAVQTLAD